MPSSLKNQNVGDFDYSTKSIIEECSCSLLQTLENNHMNSDKDLEFPQSREQRKWSQIQNEVEEYLKQKPANDVLVSSVKQELDDVISTYSDIIENLKNTKTIRRELDSRHQQVLETKPSYNCTDLANLNSSLKNVVATLKDLNNLRREEIHDGNKDCSEVWSKLSSFRIINETDLNEE